MQKQNVLVVDPDPRERAALCESLESCGYYPVKAFDEGDAVKKMRATPCDLILISYAACVMDSIDFLNQIHSEREGTRVVFLATVPAVEDAVELMKAGASDFLVKPVPMQHIRLLVEQAFFGAEGSDTKDTQAAHAVDIITKSPEVRRLLALAGQVADSGASVLIQGESGTGKELFARYIHAKSNRNERAFVAVNCAALPESLLESELFGHEKGAFTGAIAQKAGKFELADGGTLLLDEVTEMQFHLQSKLLRVLQEKEIDRVGGLRPVRINVRVIGTSNRDIRTAIQKGEFREDLYYRLNTIPLKIPPLRERAEDIELLARYFIQKYNQIDGRNVKTLTAGALQVLDNHPFKGNVRELENIIQRAVLLSDGETIAEKDLMLEESTLNGRPESEKGQDLPTEMMTGPLKEIEKKMIFHTLDKTQGNRTHAAKILGISVRTLRNKLNEYKESLSDVEEDDL